MILLFHPFIEGGVDPPPPIAKLTNNPLNKILENCLNHCRDMIDNKLKYSKSFDIG